MPVIPSVSTISYLVSIYAFVNAVNGEVEDAGVSRPRHAIYEIQYAHHLAYRMSGHKLHASPATETIQLEHCITKESRSNMLCPPVSSLVARVVSIMLVILKPLMLFAEKDALLNQSNTAIKSTNRCIKS